MSKTLGQIIGWADSIIPNKVATSDKYVLLSDLLGEGDFRKYNSFETVYEFQIGTSAAEYNLPTGIQVPDITYVGVTATTYNTTNVLASTTPFTEYKYIGRNDEGMGYTDYTSQLAFVPKPTGSYHCRIKYVPFYGPYAASSDSTTIIHADNSLINYLQYKLSARICQSMAFPRIDLGNNFEISAETELSNAKGEYYRKKRYLSKKTISYKGWW